MNSKTGTAALIRVLLLTGGKAPCTWHKQLLVRTLEVNELFFGPVVRSDSLSGDSYTKQKLIA